MPRSSSLTVTDQFCGAGGSSQGAVAAGAEVRLAMNHWDLAIETHNTNFPDTDHVLADISNVDPRRYPTTDILITSPECTNHSLAKGQKRKNLAQLPLFGDYQYDPSAERSRATMWDVPRFAEFHDYRLIIVENVVDARYWRLWDAWLQAMHALDYEHQIVYFNSMFAHPTPQSRDRMYIVFWKRGNKAPDLDIRPPAFCTKCSKDIEAFQSWKKGLPWGRYRKQYVYRCPVCHEEVTPYYYAAANAIDWSDLGTRIGDRKKPLKPKTLERIQYGLDKFGRQPAFTQVDYSHSSTPRTKPLTEALPTQSTRQTFALSTPPFLTSVNYFDPRPRGIDEALPTQTTANKLALTVPPFILGYYTRQNPAVQEVSDALPTQSTQPRHYLVTDPYFIKYYGGNRTAIPATSEPLSTVLATDHHGMVVPPPYIIELRRTGKARSTKDPLATVTAGGNHHGLVVPPFLSSYYGQKQASAISDAVPTVTTMDKHALVSPDGDLRVEDCYFRMLQPHEIQSAMGFNEDYEVLGNKRDKVKQLGNAVTPPVMKMLIERCVATFQ